MTGDERDDFLARQREHFADADVDHFVWQTSGPGFAAREAAFVRALLLGAELPLLEIGCGEGANLLHLAVPAPAQRAATAASGSTLRVGVDAFARKLAFAARAVPDARFACADAGRLPFAGGTFATVLIRDVLHHLPEPRATIADACRVLRPGGAFVLVEPNARNPLIRLQMTLVPAERGAARSDEVWLRSLLAGQPLEGLTLSPAAPFPLDRVLLHHRFGMPRLGASRAVLRALDRLDALAGRVMPAGRWSYLIARARRTP
jgi:SAM-dependent methyltransferase